MQQLFLSLPFAIHGADCVVFAAFSFADEHCCDHSDAEGGEDILVPFHSRPLVAKQVTQLACSSNGLQLPVIQLAYSSNLPLVNRAACAIDLQLTRWLAEHDRGDLWRVDPAHRRPGALPHTPKSTYRAWVFCMSRYANFEFRGSAGPADRCSQPAGFDRRGVRPAES